MYYMKHYTLKLQWQTRLDCADCLHNTVLGSKNAQLHHLLFSPFRHIADLTFAFLVRRHFEHTLTSSGHAHLDWQCYDTACHVTCECASDVAENLGSISCTGQGNDFVLIPMAKTSPVRDWRSTLHNSRFCHVQSHVTQKLRQISKIQSDQIKILCPCSRISGQLPAPIVNGEGDSFWKWLDFQIWKEFMTLTLDRVILHTVVHQSQTPTYLPNFIEIEETFCGLTYGRTDIWDPLY